MLASASATRRRLLDAAGVAFEVVASSLDEEAEKAQLRARGLRPAAQALALAEAKALAVSRARAGVVIGADQMLQLGEDALDKPRSRDEARSQLLRLRGRTHRLPTAVALARGGEVVWRRLEEPRLTARAFSDAFLEAYLDAAGDSATSAVGAYHLEGRGAQLFERLDGDFFTVLGLPLLPLLEALRELGLAPR